MSFSIKDYKLQVGDLIIEYYNKECGLITEIYRDIYNGEYAGLKFSATPGFLMEIKFPITANDIKFLVKRNRLVIHTRDGYKIDFKGRRRINKQNIF